MKSRVSFFNFHAFKKDVRRFAPLWGLYSVGLALAYLILMTEPTSFYRADMLAESLMAMVPVNFGYAFLCVQLLFGDLFQSRLCNALHALPLRRESWFGTHVAAGIAFSVVPNLVFAVLSAATMKVGLGWPVPLYWLLGNALQYLCFFGIAVFSVMLTGNRFAGAVVYGLINFLSMLVWWLADSLYEPLLPGVRVAGDGFIVCSPVVKLLTLDDVIHLQSHQVKDVYGGIIHRYVESVALSGEIWWYAGYAAAGIGLLVVSLLLYRKRALECAGDFMAFKSTEPVLLVIYTLAVGGFFHLFSEVLGSGPEQYIFLVVGLLVGYFTGTMLIERSTRVFRRKTFLRFALFAAVFALSLGLTALDPLGITRWVPDGEDVVSVNLSTRYEHYGYSEGDMDITDPDAIGEIIAAHEYQIGRTHADELREYDDAIMFNVCIEYTLKNGTTHSRFYEVNVLSECGEALKEYYGSFAYVMGFPESEIPAKAKDTIRIYSMNHQEELDGHISPAMDPEALLRAIAADCAAGTLCQVGAYHGGDWNYTTYMEIGFRTDVENSNMDYRFLHVYKDSVNTLRWMEENGLYDPNALPEK